MAGNILWQLGKKLASVVAVYQQQALTGHVEPKTISDLRAASAKAVDAAVEHGRHLGETGSAGNFTPNATLTPSWSPTWSPTSAPTFTSRVDIDLPESGKYGNTVAEVKGAGLPCEIHVGGSQYDQYAKVVYTLDEDGFKLAGAEKDSSSYAPSLSYACYAIVDGIKYTVYGEPEPGTAYPLGAPLNVKEAVKIPEDFSLAIGNSHNGGEFIITNAQWRDSNHTITGYIFPNGPSGKAVPISSETTLMPFVYMATGFQISTLQIDSTTPVSVTYPTRSPSVSPSATPTRLPTASLKPTPWPSPTTAPSSSPVERPTGKPHHIRRGGKHPG